MSATPAKRPPAPAACVIPATKFQLPRARVSLVPREALVAAVGGRSHRLLTLISAPAGFGKTTLLTLWHLSPVEERPFAWLSLDESDADPVRFWSCVIEALRTIVPGTGTAAEAALTARRADLEDVVVGLLINDVAAWEQPAVLVLDDLHLVGDERVHRSLAYLLDHMPATLHLAVATREDPDLPLGRLRARDEVVEIRSGHLRFSDEEAAAFLHHAFGLELAGTALADLQRRTEGWAAALQLAGLSVRDHGGEVLAGFDGDDRHLVDYLAGEVLARVPPDLRTFMIGSSVLSRMSGSLCEAVTGDPKSAERLAELERRNLFTVSLDPQRRWYRFHPLFGDVLRGELGDEAAVLHRRAATWWLAVDAVPEAITHAIAAADIDLVAELVASHWASVFNRGWLTTVSGWLSVLPQDAIAADTRLWLARAWTFMDLGESDEAGAWLRARARGGRVGRRPARAAALQARRRRRRRRRGGRRGRGRASGGPLLADGRRRRHRRGRLLARALCRRAPGAGGGGADRGRERQRAGAPVRPGLSGARRRGARRAAFRRQAAARAAGRAPGRRALHGDDRPPWPARGPRSLKGRLSEAEREAARASELSRRGAGILEQAAAAVAHARVLAALGQRDAARARFAHADALLSTCADAGTLARALAQAGHAPGLAAPREPRGAGEPLSDSELAVLRMLHSELSLREIGSGPLPLAQHDQDPHAPYLRQAGRPGPRPGRRARARAGIAVSRQPATRR